MLPASFFRVREFSSRSLSQGIAALPLLCLLTACGPDYSPNTYASTAVQHAEKVDQGVVVGERVVAISADSTVGTATGAAAGGIAGSQIGDGAVSALSAVGGSVAGGLVGTAIAHGTDDTFGYEYIVRKPNGDLLSVTQKDMHPLAIGQHVLIIEGSQARIVPDYTVQVADAPHSTETPKTAEASKADAKPPMPAKPDAAPSPSQPAPASAAKPDQPSAIASAPLPAATQAPSSSTSSQPSASPPAPAKADGAAPTAPAQSGSAAPSPSTAPGG